MFNASKSKYFFLFKTYIYPQYEIRMDTDWIFLFLFVYIQAIVFTNSYYYLFAQIKFCWNWEKVDESHESHEDGSSEIKILYVIYITWTALSLDSFYVQSGRVFMKDFQIWISDSFWYNLSVTRPTDS